MIYITLLNITAVLVVGNGDGGGDRGQNDNDQIKVVEVDKLIHGWKLFSVMFRFSSLVQIMHKYIKIFEMIESTAKRYTRFIC